MSTTFTPIRDLGEFALIDRMQTILGASDDADVVLGIDDDAGVYRIGEGRVHVITTDALIEAIHFDRVFMPMEYLGFKALSVNVSDVLAMNALPRYATIALGVPDTISVEMVEALYRGLQHAASAYNVTILGGDTTAARFLTLAVTVIGEANEQDIIYRSGAQPGDVLCVTGDVGAAYAGLKVMLDQRRALEEEGAAYQPNLTPYQYVIQRQLAPLARRDVIEDWAAREARPHALIDISDGVASEVHHLCEQSGCGAIIHSATLPIAPDTRGVADLFAEDVDTYALYGGEDYELLFTMSEDELEKLDPESYVAIGLMTEATDGVQVQMPEGDVIPLSFKGYQHFDGDESGEEML